jgi:hypothetical protein
LRCERRSALKAQPSTTEFKSAFHPKVKTRHTMAQACNAA